MILSDNPSLSLIIFFQKIARISEKFSLISFTSNTLAIARLELFAPMKMFLKSLDVGYSFKNSSVTAINAPHTNHLEES